MTIPGLDVPKAKRYNRVRLAVLLLGIGESVAKMGWFAFSGRSASLQRRTWERVPDRRLATPAYVAAVTAASWLSHLPRSYVTGHLVERRFDLTKQSSRGWLGDEVKGLLLSVALQVPLVTGAYAVMHRRPRDWWAILAAVTVPLTVVLGNLAPVLIMPIFNKFELLKDPELADRVKRLAERAGVRIADVYQMDMSRQTEKANAFFTGIGNTKRVVLGDTLIEQFTPEEIEAVVAHELGHQVHGDIWRLIALGSVLGAGSTYAVHKLTPPLLARTASRSGVTDLSDVASLPILGLVMTAIGFALVPIQNAVGRAIERRTDRYAIELTGDGPTYAAAMTRLASQNLSDPDPSGLVVFFLYSHPPIAERIAMASSYGAASAQDRPQA